MESVTNFVSHSFSCFNDLKLDNAIIMAARIMSIELVFHKLSEKVSLVDLKHWEQGF